MPIAEQSEDNFDRVMTVNAKGTFLCLKDEIAHMLKNGRRNCKSRLRCRAGRISRPRPLRRIETCNQRPDKKRCSRIFKTPAVGLLVVSLNSREPSEL